ncbi:MAG TPA: hypothetical protein VD836_16960 [Solirubrobacteraceae bacterium]|nr:hypothetical protein [Solirubrobacteraceae bacterium]
MTITVVRYRVRPGLEIENARLVRDVYRELHATAPADVAYSTLLLEDGTFLHVAELEDPTALRRVEAFKTFRDGLEDRVAEPPLRVAAERLGAYAPSAEALLTPR